MASNDNMDFDTGDYVVYPAHGVGRVEGREELTVGGMDVTLIKVFFENDRLHLKLPMEKLQESGLRKLCSHDRLTSAMDTLKGRARIRRTMWSRRAQEYEMKINSGDPVSIAEVLRDLRKNHLSGEQSYSERQIYESALERLAREVAVIEDITHDKAATKLETVMKEAA